MSRKITFKVGIPVESVTVDPDEVNEEMKKGLEWWQGEGPKNICPFISARGRCIELCGKVFPDIENAYKTCPFKQIYNEALLKPLVQKILDEISK